jgi:hypothetical protein
MGDRPQAIINKQLGQQCDVLVGVFWTRLGTNTGVAESGTVEEIEEFRKNKKPVLLYFSSARLEPEKIDHEQYQKLITYKNSLQDQGIVFSYDSVGTFRELLQRHLASTIGDLLIQQDKSSEFIPILEESEEIKNIKMLKSQFESFLRRFEAEWAAERDSEPFGIDDGKYILKNASEDILSFFKSQIVKDDKPWLTVLLQESLKRIKELNRHEIYLDGGVSYNEFWKEGNMLIEKLKNIPEMLGQTLRVASKDQISGRQ